MDEKTRYEKELPQEIEYEDLRFLLVDTKMIFEVSKEEAKKLETFTKLNKEIEEKK